MLLTLPHQKAFIVLELPDNHGKAAEPCAHEGSPVHVAAHNSMEFTFLLVNLIHRLLCMHYSPEPLDRSAASSLLKACAMLIQIGRSCSLASESVVTLHLNLSLTCLPESATI